MHKCFLQANNFKYISVKLTSCDMFSVHLTYASSNTLQIIFKKCINVFNSISQFTFDTTRTAVDFLLMDMHPLDAIFGYHQICIHLIQSC